MEKKNLRSQEECSERSVQFWKQNAFLTYAWRFLRSNTIEQLEFKLGKIAGI